MNNHNEHINYSAKDIERYLRGEMSSAEMHALEKAALDDPFLAEALEGYTDSKNREVVVAMHDLQNRLQQRAEPAAIIRMPAARRWLSIAAAVFIIAGTITTWYFLQPTTVDGIVQEKQTLNELNDSAAIQALVQSAADSTIPGSGTETETKEQAKRPTPARVAAGNKAETQQEQAATQPAPPVTLPAIKANERIETFTTPEQEEKVAKETVTNDRRGFRNLSLNKKESSLPATSRINTYVFSGTVKDSLNNGLPFLNISIPNTPLTTYTDARGGFRIITGDSTVTLRIKGVGLREKDVHLAHTDGVTEIFMEHTGNALSVGAITGYGKRSKQKPVSSSPQNLDSEELEAEPVDGWFSYEIYLQNNTQVQNVDPLQMQGTVDLLFSVDKFGTPHDFKVEHSNCPKCEKEAIRLIKQGPRWKINGTAKTAKVSLTLYF